MEKLIFWIIYGSGFIIGYYFHRRALKKYMSLYGFGDDWFQVCFSLFVALFLWMGFIVTLIMCFVCELFSAEGYNDGYNDNAKPPKWL